MISSRLEMGVAPGEEVEDGDRGDGALRVAAWCVHLYTAIGLILAAWIAVLLVRGGAESFRAVFVLMLVATLVDATDGTLARKFRVKSILPGFDGRKLDDITDFLTYTSLPLLLIWRAGLLPEGTEAWLLLPLLASAYGFCQADAKTDDGYFLGFPSLWNVVALYLYVLQVPGWLAVGIVVVLSLLTFVPSRYLYPSSKPGVLNKASNLLGAPWCVLLLVVLWRLPSEGPITALDGPTWWLAAGSLYFPAFYMAASWAVTIRHRRSRPI
ncbi:CDP-alcohol phosphatidyltransferase family protein [Tundrisphaera lichenicola]|uniref:CDP-alcohol phosphatidyltransferase family protein n=1 Tax=Tundrisphaera lichenicola TaxID=2029860 RepID=UPI003EB77F61